MKKLILFIAVGALAASCSSSMYNWGRYDNAVYSYSKKSDEKSLEKLMATYQKLISNPKGTRKMPPPGVCADYGYLCILNGKEAEGIELLKKEKELYPESAPFIDLIIKRFEE